MLFGKRAEFSVARVQIDSGIKRGPRDVRYAGLKFPASICEVGTKYCRKPPAGCWIHVFVRPVEEQLVVVLVEVGTRNNHRTAKVAAGVVETVGRRGHALAVVVPSVAVEHAIARVEITLSMEVGAAALADRLEGNRAFGKLRAERVGQNRNLLHLVLINVGGLCPLIAGVEQVCAVRRHRHAAV